jgi:hypothetical protein
MRKKTNTTVILIVVILVIILFIPLVKVPVKWETFYYEKGGTGTKVTEYRKISIVMNLWNSIKK